MKNVFCILSLAILSVNVNAQRHDFSLINSLGNASLYTDFVSDVTIEGRFIVVGVNYEFDNNNRFVIFEFDSDNNTVLWSKSYEFPFENVSIKGIKHVNYNDHKFVVIGTMNNNQSNVFSFIAKLDHFGDILDYRILNVLGYKDLVFESLEHFDYINEQNVIFVAGSSVYFDYNDNRDYEEGIIIAFSHDDLTIHNSYILKNPNQKQISFKITCLNGDNSKLIGDTDLEISGYHENGFFYGGLENTGFNNWAFNYLKSFNHTGYTPSNVRVVKETNVNNCQQGYSLHIALFEVPSHGMELWSDNCISPTTTPVLRFGFNKAGSNIYPLNIHYHSLDNSLTIPSISRSSSTQGLILHNYSLQNNQYSHNWFFPQSGPLIPSLTSLSLIENFTNNTTTENGKMLSFHPDALNLSNFYLYSHDLSLSKTGIICNTDNELGLPSNSVISASQITDSYIDFEDHQFSCNTLDDVVAFNSLCNQDFKQQQLLFDDNFQLSIAMISPNPSTGIFTLTMDLPSSQNMTVRIVDMVGRQIWYRDYGNVPSGSFVQEFNLNRAARGVYLIEVTTTQGKFTKRVVLE